ncbi:MAG TPA: SIMPL domain-containing protein [Candidatus Eisenbacteria bacterium]|nr:SIMPL domain-containing protein [Candidatus Eisenbacteria bacterium]
MNGPSSPANAILLAVAIALAGWFVGGGFVRSRTTDRFVTVKGVAERIVDANIGLWPLRLVATDNVLSNAQTKIESQRTAVMAFLQKHGLESAEVEIQGVEVNDVRANPYRGPGEMAGDRYIVNMLLMVRSDQPAKILAASQQVGELLTAGVVLSSAGGHGPYGGPTYIFSKLNDLKPEMIAEATASARKAAEQFAKDSRSRIGGIRRASQGVFEIQARDNFMGTMEGSQLHKTLRVVSTIDYYLTH